LSTPLGADRHLSGEPLVLLTGATGYVGGRLLEVLQVAGMRLRCLARRPAHLTGRAVAGTEIVAGDARDAAALRRALAGVHTACYLVHSLGEGRDFAAHEREGAARFAAAAREAGVSRIVYLGGLGRGPGLSPHLASRQEVGRVLAAGGVPVIELRASIIIGSGSLSFEMIRALVEKLPFMIVPRWASLRAQPIAIEDVIAYLQAALTRPDLPAGVYEIGGVDRVTYLDIMREYARQRGLRRVLQPVPVLTPRLSGLWLGLVTPVQARVGRQLVLSLTNETVVTDDAALRQFAVRPRGLREAIARALANEDHAFALTRWTDALSSHPPVARWAGRRFGHRFVDSHVRRVAAGPEQAFAPVARFGGQTGWYFADWLWRLRGWLDLCVGGPGLRRGRRDPVHLRVGDSLDFWRVEAIEPARLLRLAAEMRLPGRAWLQFEVVPDGTGSLIRQTALFDPVGLGGLIYWYALYPLHAVMFRGMLRGLAAAIAPEPVPPRA
jgi:uncharacterized protein YbjT (DUF2867 family)